MMTLTWSLSPASFLWGEPLCINIELDQPKDTMLCPDCRGIASVFFCFSFSCSSILFSEWSLSTTSPGWLAMKAQEASSQYWGRSECYCLCLFVFLIWGHSKIQLKGLQFAGYTRAFSSSERALSVGAQSSIYTLFQPTWRCDSYVLIPGCCCMRAFQPLVAKWQSDSPKLL